MEGMTLTFSAAAKSPKKTCVQCRQRKVNSTHTTPWRTVESHGTPPLPNDLTPHADRDTSLPQRSAASIASLVSRHATTAAVSSLTATSGLGVPARHRMEMDPWLNPS